ncbi:MAG: radical SAM protein, partial [Nanoarchaeota archaeon]|nr:radical SAM protein [Nanoarchaeota archaeon]
MPLVCFYYVTLKCNCKCEFCNIWQDKENFKLKEQSLAEIANNLRDLKKLHVKLIDFTGGEPLLYPNLIEALKLAKKKGFRTTITTNCLLYPKYARALKGLVDLLAISLDSTDEEKHNKIRGVKTFDKVIDTIKLAKQIKQKLYIIHTVTEDNY